ncbi:CotS family spore coat protein [Clostridium sediminicola]|uniref:CotS family spore coat protein n=1 Tax=Clostridium sediminicola TaxID=3114879 RepID=UPI0031F25F40
MALNRSIKLNDNISKDEEVILRNILARYPYSILDIKRVRSAYKIRTNKGNLCLKKFQHGKFKAKNGWILVNELYKNKFYNTAKFLKTKNNNILIKYKKYFFYVTEWIDGNECDLRDLEEAKNVIKLLANFHLTTNKINTKGMKIPYNVEKWPEIYNQKLNDFLNYKTLIQGKRIKNEFDKKYYDSIDIYYNRGIKTLSLLGDSNYTNYVKEVNVANSICHNSYYYQNIIKKDDVYYIIDLDRIVIDLQLVDLCKFISRLMSKSEYNWDFQKAKEILESYMKIKPMSKDELDIMLAMMIFPHKFWKLGRKRYYKHKNWSERKYNKKFKKLLTRFDKEDEFIKEFDKYVNDSSL